ncbi:MAG: NAD(P)/FAD-dependent oxidoreductase [Clostridia bacterium]|nr:NAD(P)/FAD-dependent oxidoreductase [Clostridia bacterium]
MEKIYDTAIVGGGIAGYTAALTAKNLLLDYIWLGEEGFGEKLRLAEKVTNFPTLIGSGSDFSAALKEQMAAEELILTPRRVEGIYFMGGAYSLTSGGETFTAKTVILATGVEARGAIRGEKEFLGRGVSYCAVCDGALYRGKRVAAVLTNKKFEEEAEYLAKFAQKVYCVCLYENPTITGEKFSVLREWPVAVEGGMRVERLAFKEHTISVDGVFFLKNSAPPESLAFGLKTEGAHVAVGRDLSTNLPGLFAAGDITGRPYQYAKAAGEGCVAAHSVKTYLRALQKK